jgi:DNA-binding CsgD family transcriptional regulator
MKIDAGASQPLESDTRVFSVALELTARESEVMGWVALGKTNAQIAEVLWVAPSTVRKHLENVYAKLGVSTRTAAVARFLGLSDRREAP